MSAEVMDMARTTYNLRYVDNGEWYRGYRTTRLDGAKTQAILVSCASLRQVAVYGGEGPYRAECWRTDGPVESKSHEFVADKQDAPRVKYGEEDIPHCNVCGQAMDRPIHRMLREAAAALKAGPI
jgi:hypothetical protein